MDIKEAIKAIKSNYPPSSYTILREALDLAIETLEKQIPKKPIKHTKLPNDKITYLCPTCNRLYWDKEFLSDWCSSCGQRFEIKK